MAEKVLDRIRWDLELDTSGLHCPLPLLKLKKALAGMASGEIVRVVATDPAAPIDFGVFAEQSGNPILHQEEVEGVFYFYIRKG